MNNDMFYSLNFDATRHVSRIQRTLNLDNISFDKTINETKMDDTIIEDESSYYDQLQDYNKNDSKNLQQYTAMLNAMKHFEKWLSGLPTSLSKDSKFNSNSLKEISQHEKVTL